MHPRVRILVLACAACAVLHLPSSTAAPISPPLVQAIHRAIASIVVQTAVSRGIAEDDSRTMGSLQSIQETLTKVARQLNVFGRTDASFSWVTLWMELGRSIGMKLVAENADARIDVDPQDGLFAFRPSAPPSYPTPARRTPAQLGTPMFEPHFVAIQAGLRVFKQPDCNYDEYCDLFPPYTQLERLTTKYYDSGYRTIITANSLGQLRAMATIRCRHWWGTGSGTTGIIEEHSDSVSLSCIDKNGEASGPLSSFLTFRNKHSLVSMADKPEVADLPITAESMTQLVNGLWEKAAAEPDYKGIAFESKKPVDTNTVQRWFEKEPDMVPRVQDLFVPLRPNGTVVSVVDMLPTRVPGRGVPPTTSGSGRGSVPGTVPDTLPGAVPGSRPDKKPGALPDTPTGTLPDTLPGAIPGSRPDARPGIVPGTHPGNRPNTLPGSIPGAVPGTRPDALPSDIASTGAVAGVGSVAGTGADTRTGVGQDVNVVNQPSVHVANPVRIETGEVPKVFIPKLESTPTAQMILKPLLDLLPGFRSWQAPAHQAECPRPTFQVFQQAVRMDAMCDIAQQNRSAIHTSMTLVFALAALFIVLSA